MELLSLDLGRTSGFAYFKNRKVRTYGTFTDPDEAYVSMRDLGQPRYVVVEKPIIVKGQLGDEMAGLIARTEAEYGGTIKYVTAAQWKPHPLTKKTIRNLKNISPHERDAICIGVWFHFVHLQSAE